MVLRFLPKFKRTLDFLLDGIRETHEEYQRIIDKHQEGLHPDIKVENVIQAFLLAKGAASGKPSESYYSNPQFYYLLADLFGAGLDTTVSTIRLQDNLFRLK